MHTFLVRLQVAALLPLLTHAFVQPTSKTVGQHGGLTLGTGRQVKHQTSTQIERWSDDPCSSSTRLNMAFNSNQPGNMFDGPTPLVKERDACGVGFVANVKASGEYGTHKVLQEGLMALDCMEHRGACGGDGESGDGAGIMTNIPVPKWN